MNSSITGNDIFIKRLFNRNLPAASIGMVVSFIVLISDEIVVGKIVGETALAAVSVVCPLSTISNFFFYSTLTGSTLLFARNIGELNPDGARRIFSIGLITSCFWAVSTSLITYFGRDIFFSFMGITGEVRELAEEYLSFLSLSFLLTPIVYYLIELIYEDGDVNVSSTANILLITGNLTFSVLLTLRLGIKGAAIGTVIGNVLALLVLSVHFFKKGNNIRFKLVYSFSDLFEIIKLSLTECFAFLAQGGLNLFLNKMMILLYGEFYLPVLALAMNAWGLFLFFDGIGMSVSPIAEGYLGEENYSAERSLFRYALKIAVIESVSFSVILFLAAPYFPIFFEISSPELIEASAEAVRIMAFMALGTGEMFFLCGHCMNIRKISMSVGIIICLDFLFPVLCVIPCIYMFDMKGLWIGLASSSIILLTLTLLYIYVRFGKESFPHMLGKEPVRFTNVSAKLDEKGIQTITSGVKTVLSEYAVSEKVKNRVELLIEECFNLVIERNPGKKIYAECSIAVSGDSVRLILRDNGVLYDVTDPNVKMSSFRSYVVGNIMAHIAAKQYLATQNYNRSIFDIPVNL